MGRKKKRMEEEELEEHFPGYNIFEYNIFWIVHLLIAVLTIAAIGGNPAEAFKRFFQIVNPDNWF